MALKVNLGYFIVAIINNERAHLKQEKKRRFFIHITFQLNW